MSTTGQPDWTKMTSAEFSAAKQRATQDALFITDEPDPYGTPAIEGISGHIVHPNPEK